MELAILVDGAGTHAEVVSAEEPRELWGGERHVIAPGESALGVPYERWRAMLGSEVDLVTFLATGGDPAPPPPPAHAEREAVPPIAVTDVLDAAFRLVRAAPASLLLIAVLLMVPLFVLQRSLMSPVPDVGSILLAAALRAVWVFPTVALLTGFGRIHAGAVPTDGEVVRATLGRALPALAATVAVWLCVGSGLVLLVVPGLYVMVRLFLTVPVVVLEDCAVAEAMARSDRLSQGYGWRIFATFCVLYVLGWLSGLGLTALYLAGGMPAGVGNAVGIAMALLLVVLWAAVSTAWYFAIRVAREGYDVERAASSLTASASAGSTAPR